MATQKKSKIVWPARLVARRVVWYAPMNIAKIGSSFQQFWDYQPGMALLFVLGVGLFFYIVVDTWRLKHSHRRTH